MGETKPNDPPEFEESDFVGSLTKSDKQLQNIQEQLNAAGVGFQIAIARAEPEWCSGHLETIPVVEPERPIDIDRIVNRWGGQRLQLKIKKPDGKICGGGTIHCRSFPPKVKGVVITEESMMSLGAPMPQPQPALPQIVQQPGAQPAPNPNPLGIDIPSLMKMAMDKKGGDTALAGKLLEHALVMQQQAMKQAAAAPQVNMLKQMEGFMGMFEMFNKFKGMFGGDGGSAATSEDSMMPMLMQIAQGMMGGGNGNPPTSPPQQRRRPSAIGPPTGSAPPQMPPQPTVPTVPANQMHLPSVNTPPTPNTPVGDINLDQLAKSLCSLSAEDAAEVALNAFGNMPVEKRSVAMQTFMGDGFSEELDDSSTDVHDDTYDDEPDLSQVPGQNRFPPSEGQGGV